MICPICNSVIEKKNVCPKCGSDISVYLKVRNISNALYNKGLERAKANDFTYAEEDLKKSIRFYKNNISARNVLGLVYYETGRLSLALKEWVISSNIKKENNPAIDYVEYFQKNTKEFQNLEESVKLYNQAVKFIKQKSEDMAAIQLRKAVELNPKFVYALNLLSLCYIIQGKNDKALDIIKKVLTIDTANPDALAYFKELCPDGTRLVESIKIVKTNKVYDEPVKFEPKISKKINNKSSKFMEMLVFVAGCICTAAVMLILVFPGVADAKQEEIDRINTEMATLKNKYDEEVAQNNAEASAEVTKENEALKAELAKYQKQLDEKNALDQLTSAASLASKGDYTNAAATISSINLNMLSPEKVNEYNELKKKVYDKESKNLLKKGKDFVNSKKFQEAKEVLEKSMLYADEEPDTKFSAMYYLAKAVKELGDSAKAKEYYNQVAQNHPQSRYKNLAKKEASSL